MKPQPVVSQRALYLAGTCFGGIVLSVFILFIAAPRPVHAGAVVGSTLMGFLFSAMAAFFTRLAIADSQRPHHD
jgi:hypothetical protein